MIDSVLDFAVDHAAVFAALLSVVVVSSALAVVWVYGRWHERTARRRGVAGSTAVRRAGITG